MACWSGASPEDGAACWQAQREKTSRIPSNKQLNRFIGLSFQ